MHLGEISFCDKIGYNLKSDEFKKKILGDIEGLCQFKVIQKHYEKFSDSMIKVLSSNPHLLSLRSNGNPYLLFLTRNNFINQCIFIDKKIQQGYFYPRMIIVKFRFADNLFDGTLFDGEMVKDVDGNWIYLINDIIVDSGNVNSKINLVKRVNRIHELLEHSYIEDELDVCNLQVKRYFHYHEHNFMLQSFQEQLPYSCRGLYFKPLFIRFKDILYNFDDSLIKKVSRVKYQNTFFPCNNDNVVKEENETARNENVVENNIKQVKFVQKTNIPDVYEIFESSTALQPLGYACVNTLATSKLLRNLFLNTTPLEKKKMECQYNIKFKKWMPLTLVN